MERNVVTLQKWLLCRIELAMESNSKGRRLGTQRNQIYPNFTPCLLLIRISFRLYLDFMAESKAQFISYNPCFWRSITALQKKSSTPSSTTTLSIVWAMSWTRTRSTTKNPCCWYYLASIGNREFRCIVQFLLLSSIAYQTKPFFFNKSVNSFPFIVLRSDLS